MAKREARPPESVGELRRRIQRARVRGAAKPRADTARKALLAWLDTAVRHGLGLRDILKRLASGEAALGIGAAVHDALATDPPEILQKAACRSGCAFCCILSGGDGGTITETEARRVHAALAPFAGQPDGRTWHPAACPALDPESRTCRIYEERPLLCRSFVSTDADACRENAEGGNADGAGVLGSQVTYLAALGLVRSALEGTARPRTYALDEMAAATVAGKTETEALESARQKPRALDDAIRGTAGTAK